MNTVMVRSLAVFVCGICLSLNLMAAETNTFEWSSRPQLTSEQQRLLQLQSGIELATVDSPLRAERQAELTALQAKLGTQAVRHAKPFELMSSAGVTSNLTAIFNPTKEGLVITVSVVGDT
jgi:hypothetical protein